jgi:hypothetical protein
MRHGYARPERGEMVSCRLSADERKYLEQLATRDDRTISETIRLLLRRATMDTGE